MHDEHRNVAFRLGVDSYLHIFEAPDSPHADPRGDLLQRGHLDHMAFTAPDITVFELIRDRLVQRNASDGTITYFGMGRSLHFSDPDQMSCEVTVMLHADLAFLTPACRPRCICGAPVSAVRRLPRE